MNEIESFLGILFAIHIFESILGDFKTGVLFKRSTLFVWKKVRVNSGIELGNRVWKFSGGIFPNMSFRASSWPLSFGSEGVCIGSPLQLPFEFTTPLYANEIFSWEDLKSAIRIENRLYPAGEQKDFVSCATEGVALFWLKRLSVLAKLDSEHRMQQIQEWIVDSKSDTVLSKRLFNIKTPLFFMRILDWTLFAVLYGALPYFAFEYSLSVALIYAGIPSLILSLSIALFYRITLKKLPETNRMGGWIDVFSMAICPPCALRALEKIGLRMSVDLHPLAVSEFFLAKKDVEFLKEAMQRDLEFAPKWENRVKVLSVDNEFRKSWLKNWNQSPGNILKEKQCPRCLEIYPKEGSLKTCPDCPGVLLNNEQGDSHAK